MTYQLSRQTKVCIHIRTGLHALVDTKWILNEPLSVLRGTKVGGEEVCSGEEWRAWGEGSSPGCLALSSIAYHCHLICPSLLPLSRSPHSSPLPLCCREEWRKRRADGDTGRQNDGVCTSPE